MYAPTRYHVGPGTLLPRDASRQLIHKQSAMRAGVVFSRPHSLLLFQEITAAFLVDLTASALSRIRLRPVG